MQIASRAPSTIPITTSSVSSGSSRIEVSAVNTNSGTPPVIFTAGSLKNVTPITTMTNVGKAVIVPQMSVSGITSKAAVPVPTLPMKVSSVPGVSFTNISNSIMTSGRTYMVTTQAPTSVAKLLPHSIIATSTAASVAKGSFI